MSSSWILSRYANTHTCTEREREREGEREAFDITDVFLMDPVKVCKYTHMHTHTEREREREAFDITDVFLMDPFIDTHL